MHLRAYRVFVRLRGRTDVCVCGTRGVEVVVVDPVVACRHAVPANTKQVNSLHNKQADNQDVQAC